MFTNEGLTHKELEEPRVKDKMAKKLTKEEFEKRYCKRGKISLALYHKHRVTLPCACGYEDCQGWAAVFNDRSSIEHHMRFYAPLSGAPKSI